MVQLFYSSYDYREQRHTRYHWLQRPTYSRLRLATRKGNASHRDSVDGNLHSGVRAQGARKRLLRAFTFVLEELLERPGLPGSHRKYLGHFELKQQRPQSASHLPNNSPAQDLQCATESADLNLGADNVNTWASERAFLPHFHLHRFCHTGRASSVKRTVQPVSYDRSSLDLEGLQ